MANLEQGPKLTEFLFPEGRRNGAAFTWINKNYRDRVKIVHTTTHTEHSTWNTFALGVQLADQCRHFVVNGKLIFAQCGDVYVVVIAGSDQGAVDHIRNSMRWEALTDDERP